MKEKTKISAQIVADSADSRGNRLTSLIVTFPRIILSELLTHRMLSKNTSSSRAIPFKKMVEAVQNDPFIPIAWQKNHSGMQGTEYITDKRHYNLAIGTWIMARDEAVKRASELNSGLAKLLPNGESKVLTNIGVTKQLCNRLLEPFMWTTMLITGSKEGWDNFFRLRCPQYYDGKQTHKSKIEYCKANNSDTSEYGKEYWQAVNNGQAEIHMMDLAEKIYDVMNESTPKQLKSGQWHIPYYSTMEIPALQDVFANANPSINIEMSIEKYIEQIEILAVKVSTAMAARESYTVVGNEKDVDYKKQIELHDRLITLNHSSPLEHCALCVTTEEYNENFKGKEKGWFRNFKGFKSYRQILEE